MICSIIIYIDIRWIKGKTMPTGNKYQNYYTKRSPQLEIITKFYMNGLVQRVAQSRRNTYENN